VQRDVLSEASSQQVDVGVGIEAQIGVSRVVPWVHIPGEREERDAGDAQAREIR
jgi:hypothetical protein